MAKKGTGTRIFGWNPSSLLEKASISKTQKQNLIPCVYIVGRGGDASRVANKLKDRVPEWQLKKVGKAEKELHSLTAPEGPIWIIELKKKENKENGYDLAPASEYAQARNAMGPLWAQVESQNLEKLAIVFEEMADDEKVGALVGLEIALYRYMRTQKEPKTKTWPEEFVLAGVSEKLVNEAIATSLSVNLARHLVNTPPNILNPVSYSETLAQFFKGFADVKVDVWSTARLEKEKMGLILAVGQGSAHGPCMLHIRYRPKGAAKKKKPIAFVGKGITFDSGGLDIKPASAMRLMKKDMGGSAAIAGIAHYVLRSGIKVPCDFYLPMAENMVDKRAFRPGDVFTSRQGMTVEIDNTDAEGRLILADALDVAVTQTGENEPDIVVNVATLTGAARVAVGTEIGALFSTDHRLAEKCFVAGMEKGDYVWRMPLFQNYESGMASHFADTNHCSTSGFAGASTAALFLKKFVKGKRWVHLDVMAWTDAKGAYRESGGNGQTVQCLIEFIKSL